MTKEQKSQAIREFFLAPKPLIDSRAITIGAVVAMIGLLSLFGDGGSAAGLFIAAGVLWALCWPLGARAKGKEPKNEVAYFSLARYSSAKARFAARPSLGQLLNWLREGLSETEKHAALRLGLEETTRDPISVIGPLYDDSVGSDDAARGFSKKDVLRRSVDGGYFYSTYRISVFHFTENFLGAYQANYNMIKDVSTDEHTDEFFYRDVVAVRTQTESSNYTLKSGERLEQAKTFSLTVSSGDRISLVINDPKINAAPDLESLGEKAIANVRSMLRQYKTVPKTA